MDQAKAGDIFSIYYKCIF